MKSIEDAVNTAEVSIPETTALSTEVVKHRETVINREITPGRSLTLKDSLEDSTYTVDFFASMFGGTDRTLASRAAIELGLFTNEGRGVKIFIVPTEQIADLFIKQEKSWEILDSKKKVFRDKYRRVIFDKMCVMDFEERQTIEREALIERQKVLDSEYRVHLQKYLTNHTNMPDDEWVSETQAMIAKEVA